MKRNSCSNPNPSCELRTQGVRNCATTGVASATASATAAQPKSDNHLLAKQIREAREIWTAQQRAQLDHRRGATSVVDFGRSSCVPSGHNRLPVGAPPWCPSTPEEVAEEQRSVADQQPRLWWWKPRYRLADLERDGMDRAEVVAKVRAECEAVP